MTTETPTRTYYDGNGSRYEKAKEQVEEVQGNLWTERDRWRLVALILAVGMIVLACVAAYLGRQPANEPLYLSRNEEGQYRLLGWDAFDPTMDEIKRDLIVWMRCLRGIPMDRQTLERCWRIVPMFLLDRTPARSLVASYFAKMKPDKALFQKSVDVGPIEAMREPDGRWRLDWNEDTYHLPKGGGLGKLESRIHHTAIMIVTRQKPTKRSQVVIDNEPVNPLGLYITHLGWSEANE